MARMQGSILGLISGKVGGAEFAVVGGKNVLKSAKSRGQKHTPNQIRSQTQHIEATRAWRDLTADQRRAWKTAAAQRQYPDSLGNTRNLSAFQLWLTIPHDFRNGAGNGFYPLPPTRTNTIQNPPNVLECSTFNIVVENLALVYNIVDTAALYIARFQKAYSHMPSRWFKAGLMKPVNVNDLEFYDSMALFNVKLIPGEIIHMKLMVHTTSYWPIWMDLGLNTVT